MLILVRFLKQNTKSDFGIFGGFLYNETHSTLLLQAAVRVLLRGQLVTAAADFEDFGDLLIRCDSALADISRPASEYLCVQLVALLKVPAAPMVVYRLLTSKTIFCAKRGLHPLPFVPGFVDDSKAHWSMNSSATCEKMRKAPEVSFCCSAL